MSASDLDPILSRLREEVAHLDRISLDAGLTDAERLSVQSTHILATRDLRTIVAEVDALRSSVEAAERVSASFAALFNVVERTMQYQAANDRSGDDDAYDYLGLCWAALRDKISEANDPESLPDVEVAVPAKALGFALAMVTSFADALNGPLLCIGCDGRYEREQSVEHVSTCEKHPVGQEIQRLTRELAAARSDAARGGASVDDPAESECLRIYRSLSKSHKNDMLRLAVSLAAAEQARGTRRGNSRNG